MARESAPATAVRWKKLEMLQKHYASFNTFLDDVMSHMNFGTTWMQHDIAAYLQHGPQYLMVQSQRGEAKTTITACYAVWSLIQDPKHRVLIVSAGGKTANEIATLVQRIILTLDTLECLRPDPNNGDRTSVEAFDVHYALKGIDKSPSVACIGITGNLPGKRADLLIADDIESPKNSMTAANREMLLTLSLEFTAICTTGRIIYLGTPQTGESIYNTLPGRGFEVRIWPGRYPSPKERPNYGPHLAPSILRRMEADPTLCYGGGVLGDAGKPTDPELLNEETHQAKLRDRGASSYQLNYMLNTRLMDAMRFPLKLENLVTLRADPLSTQFPLVIMRGFGPQSQKGYTSSGFSFIATLPHSVSAETAVLQGKHMHIDPAGGGKNGDETSYGITGFLNSNVFLLASGGVPGGYENEPLQALADIAVKHQPNTISIEKNMGHGAFAAVWLPMLRKAGWKGTVSEDFESGQKEVRIIDTLEPVMGRGSLIVLEDVIERDDAQTERYIGNRQMYSLFFQLAKLTRMRKSLTHDDRADALEGAVRPWIQHMVIDQEERVESEKRATLAAWTADPLGRGRYITPSRTGTSMLSKYRK